MTQTAHFTTASTWTVPANITQVRARVAGGIGLPQRVDTSGSWDGGGGAVIEAIIAVSGSVSVGPGTIAGGAAGYGSTNRGGAGSHVNSQVFAGGGGGGGYDAGPRGQRGGSATGGDGDDGGFYLGTPARGGKADGTGGAGASAYSGSAGTAGQSHASGGAGGKGGASGSTGGGGGGGGFAGGGGGAAQKNGTNPDPVGGGAGSSSGGAFVGYNSISSPSGGAPYVDLFWASTPLAPTLLKPVSAAPINRATEQVFSWRHNGASQDMLDAQAAFQLRYRLVGAGSWTTLAKTVTPDQSYTFAALALAAGNYEWQVSTFADGLQGPYSTSEYFTAADLPPTPIITSPMASSTIQTVTIPITWTSIGQVEYQARVITGTTVLADTGAQVSTTTTRSLNVTTNHIGAHVQVRIRNASGGLWSDYADVAISIEWAGPPQPRVTLTTSAGTGSLLISVTNPAGTDPIPTADYNDVFISEQIDGVYGDFERRATNVAPNTTWEYMLPAGDCRVRVDAIVAATQVQTSSAVIS